MGKNKRKSESIINRQIKDNKEDGFDECGEDFETTYGESDIEDLHENNDNAENKTDPKYENTLAIVYQIDEENYDNEDIAFAMMVTA